MSELKELKSHLKTEILSRDQTIERLESSLEKSESQRREQEERECSECEALGG